MVNVTFTPKFPWMRIRSQFVKQIVIRNQKNSNYLKRSTNIFRHFYITTHIKVSLLAEQFFANFKCLFFQYVLNIFLIEKKYQQQRNKCTTIEKGIECPQKLVWGTKQLLEVGI